MAAPIRLRLRRSRKLFVRCEEVLNHILKENDVSSSTDDDNDDQDHDFHPNDQDNNSTISGSDNEEPMVEDETDPVQLPNHTETELPIMTYNQREEPSSDNDDHTMVEDETDPNTSTHVQLPNHTETEISIVTENQTEEESSDTEEPMTEDRCQPNTLMHTQTQTGMPDQTEKQNSRKKKRNPETWRKNKTKALTAQGKSHKNWTGKVIPEKFIKTTKDCTKCKSKCSTKVSNDSRQMIFDAYYNLSTDQQRYFIINTTACNPVKRRTTCQENVRNNAFNFFFDIGNNCRVQVCKSFYLDTLAISQKKVYNMHAKKTDCDTPNQDGRGKKSNKGFIDDIKNIIREHINSFPVVESHYCRADSKKNHLEAGLNVNKMYELYVKFCSEKEVEQEPVKSSYYRHIFSTEFNFDFHQPKTDRCDFCEAHRVKAENGIVTEEDEQNILKHDSNKAAMRENRKVDRAMRDGDVAVVSFDLQNVITCPRAEISCFFYKRKLNVYNEIAVASICGKIQAICAIWAETTSGREGNDIASSVLKILEETVKLKPDIKKIITWSDSCVLQNKNAFMSTAIMNFLERHPQIESVEMKYSLPGHSAVQEVDQVHSALEKSFAISEFYSPLSLLNIILKTNRQNPYKVIQMRDSHFLKFQSILHKQL